MLPSQYAWLNTIGTLPRTITEAAALYGVHEIAGPANSPTIMAWAAEVGLKATYTADAIPWCGLFAALVCKRAGKQIPEGPLWALNWAHFGVRAGQPELGDVLVFVRPGGGHVGFYVGEDSTAYHVLGGNTSDAVSIARLDKHRLHAVRQPIYTNKPATVRPFILNAGGAALSLNEA